MPIKPENRHRYPPNWREISIGIRHGRAGGRCEQCGIPNGVWRNHRTGRWTHDAGLAEAWLDGDKIARIVLTVAHLDHDPSHSDPANLRALCQRCHNRHDAPHHRQTAQATRHHGKATGDLFDAHL